MKKPKPYMQTDSAWASFPYAGGTIGGSGCGPTSMAMAVTELTGKNLNPQEACAWATRNGFAANGQGPYYSYFAAAGREYGIDVEQLNFSDLRNMAAGQAKVYHEKAEEAVKNGDIVISCMGKGLWTKTGHFVLWWGLDGPDVHINDPNSTVPARIKNTLEVFERQVKYYFICKARAGGLERDFDLVQRGAALSAETMKFLHAQNRYGDALIAKLAAVIKDAGRENREAGITVAEARETVKTKADLDEGTMTYLSRYLYGDELIVKLARAML
jgi:hypothetical protein